MSTSRRQSSEDLLNSWKEIAAYLQRGIRTVQRWETEFGLPVRRPAGKSRSAVIAIRADLDAWLKHCSISRNGNEPGRMVRMNGSGRLVRAHETRLETRKAIEKCAALQLEMVRTCAELRQAVERYSVTVRGLKLPPSPHFHCQRDTDSSEEL
jgi:hypothetical protein